MSFEDMMKKAKTADGFLAALDQSGGSTPKALKGYGVPDDVSAGRLLLLETTKRYVEPSVSSSS